MEIDWQLVQGLLEAHGWKPHNLSIIRKDGVVAELPAELLADSAAMPRALEFINNNADKYAAARDKKAGARFN